MEFSAPYRRLSFTGLFIIALSACASDPPTADDVSAIETPQPQPEPPSQPIAADNDPVAAWQSHVIAIDTVWPDGSSSNGFGFVVGADENEVYLATANHVVRRRGPGNVDPTSISTRLFERQGRHFEARLLSTYNGDIDLAIITIPRLPGIAWRQDLVIGSPPDRGTEVWFIGRDRDWYRPARPGVVNRVDAVSRQITIDDLPVRPGTSGAPLLSRQGVVGMVTRDDGANTSATNIEVIKAAIDGWGHPSELLVRTPSERPRRVDPIARPLLPPTTPDLDVIAKMVTSVGYRGKYRDSDRKEVFKSYKFRNWVPLDPAQSTIRLRRETSILPDVARTADPAGVDAESRLAAFQDGGDFALIQHSRLPVFGQDWVYARPPASRKHFQYFSGQPLSIDDRGSSALGGFLIEYEIVNVTNDNDSCLSFVTVRGNTRIDGFFCRPGSEPIQRSDVDSLLGQISISGVPGLS